MKLVIVESPNKVHTIGNYLGNEYKVDASTGHLRDLATCGKGGLGIDVEGDFAPTYKIKKDKTQLVYQLQQDARKAEEVIIATDPDREGEAIGWHLTQILGLDPLKTKRLEFHEITRASITNAISHPKTLNMNLVASQETRRIFDRIIGFKLSSLLNKKINSPSAGRVQSATLKIICDQQKEIDAFVPEEYWNIDLLVKDGNKKIKISLDKIDDKKVEIPNKEACDLIASRIGNSVKVISVEKKTREVEPKFPFKTSTLQQEAYNIYKFSTSQTSSLAQKLFEGIDVGGDRVGLVTYIRTDSTVLSQTFTNKAKAFISNVYGNEYLGKERVDTSGTLSQDAHEAIRPTSLDRTPSSVRQFLTPDLFKLYKLIYNRAVASLISNKIEEVTTITFESNGLIFKASGVHVVFDGFEKCYGKENKDVIELPEVLEDSLFEVVEIDKKQAFTKGPQPYTEAKIVETMEKLGIGRPSTYASTISTLKKRCYLLSKSGVLAPTDQGMRTSEFLSSFFPEFVDSHFTAKMEKDLDEVTDGSESRTEMVKGFYFPFCKMVEDVGSIITEAHPRFTGEFCPKCGSPMVIKQGKFGDFIACSSFPKCSYIKKEEPKYIYTGGTCPDCGKPLIERKDKKGKKFIGCSGYPSCKYIEGVVSKTKTIEEIKPCPKCNGKLILRKGKKGKVFLGCSNFPRCKHMESYENKEEI